MSRGRWKKISLDTALSSSGVGGRSHSNFRIGCVLILKNQIVTSVNSYKTSPKLTKYYKFPFFHAEASAILRIGLERCKGATIYVSRVKKDGSAALARPCEECQVLLKMAQLKHIYYSTEEGWEEL